MKLGLFKAKLDGWVVFGSASESEEDLEKEAKDFLIKEESVKLVVKKIESKKDIPNDWRDGVPWGPDEWTIGLGTTCSKIVENPEMYLERTIEIEGKKYKLVPLDEA